VEVTFSAYLPQIQSAVSIGPDGCRLKLDIPQTEKAEYTKLQAYGFGRVLRVTVQIEEDESA
jgi:hypothetical protein